jgi:DNA-binding MarR family transcriptional regulator
MAYPSRSSPSAPSKMPRTPRASWTSCNARGLVVRRPDAHDRRVQLVYLTDEGAALRPLLVPLAQQVLARATAGLKHAEQSTTLRVLKHIDRNLE